MDAPYARLEQIEPGVARVLAHNPSAFTYYGTQTYLIGDNELAIVDPGPNLDDHVDALVQAIGSRSVVAICCTHTHRDHSPAARPLSEVTGSPLWNVQPALSLTVHTLLSSDVTDSAATSTGSPFSLKSRRGV